MTYQFPRPRRGQHVLVGGRPCVVEAVWNGHGPRNVLVRFTGTLLAERQVVHVSRIRRAWKPDAGVPS